ncbi:MAG: hypothetical protein P8Y10_16190 [Gemmatimonadales bacterium]
MSFPPRPPLRSTEDEDALGYVAYIGISGNLRQRIMQHLVLRDSSVATGTKAAVLNPDYVTRVDWWTRPEFGQRGVRQAAELIALQVLDPALRSRGSVTAAAREKYKDTRFRRRMRALFSGKPAGRLDVPTLATVIERLDRQEERIAKLEEREGRRR